jgi:hypothetical protein
MMVVAAVIIAALILLALLLFLASYMGARYVREHRHKGR